MRNLKRILIKFGPYLFIIILWAILAYNRNYYTLIETNEPSVVSVGRICYNTFDTKTIYIYTINNTDELIEYDTVNLYIQTSKKSLSTSVSLKDTKKHETSGKDFKIKNCDGDILNIFIVEADNTLTNIYNSNNDIKIFKNTIYNFLIDYFVYYMAIIFMIIISFKDMKKRKIIEFKKRKKLDKFSSDDMKNILDELNDSNNINENNDKNENDDNLV